MRRRAEPTPAAPRTLAAWWWIGLLLGITAVPLGAVGIAAGGRAGVLATSGGTLLALGAVVLLQRVWTEPLHRDTRWSAAGRRLSTAVFGTWSVGVAITAVRAWGGSVPHLVGDLVAAAFAMVVLAMLAVALADRPRA